MKASIYYKNKNFIFIDIEIFDRVRNQVYQEGLD